MWRMVSAGVAAFAVVCLVGCGGGGPQTVKVTGTVTLDGTPVEGALVAFSPKSEGAQAASARTDASGKYEMDVVPGSYGVKITKTEGGAAAEAEGPAGSEENPSAAYMAAEQAGEDVMGGGGAGGGQAKNLLPEKYANPATSGFTAEVKEGGNNVFDFAMQSGS